MSRSNWLMVILVLVMVARFILLGQYPLLDTSEARYGEMARKMLELNDWLSPMFDYGVPFWGKPPLSFWLQAGSMKLLGVNEFALRLPSWLFLLASVVLIYKWAREEFCQETALLAGIILASSFLGFVAFGAVLTDPALSFSYLLAIYGYWRALQYEEAKWFCVSCVGLALGMLAKGPLILVLFSIPGLYLVLFQGLWSRLWRMPWLVACFFFAVITLPWYILAEWKTPGFWQYFFVGEHWNRFWVSAWQGDLYGNAHAQRRGYILLCALLALFPWLLSLGVWKHLKHLKLQAYQPLLVSYLLISIATLLLLFSLSKNVLWTYVLPILPLMALLMARLYKAYNPSLTQIAVMALLVPMSFGLVLLDGRKFTNWKNQQPVVNHWQSVRQLDEPLFSYKRRLYSAEYYSAGKVRPLPSDLAGLLGKRFYLTMRESYTIDEVLLKQSCALRIRTTGSKLFYCQL